jgi:hypothetical protein
MKKIETVSIIKILIFILSCFFFLRCEESKVPNKSQKTLKDIVHYSPVNFNHNWNGYKKKECIHGNGLYSNSFYKLVFRLPNVSYVTKYAYSIKYIKEYKNNYYRLSIYFDNDTENFIKTLKSNLSDCFDNFFGGVNYNYIFTANKIWMYHIPYLSIYTKDEYNKYMKNNPNTIVMEY